MAKSKIDKKIMAFIGTKDASKLVNNLADYTDDIYACTASEYGGAIPPGGNITILSKYQDEDAIKRWIDRGVNLIIDGTAANAEAHRDIIRKACEANGVEYLRVAANYDFNLNTTLSSNPDDLLRAVEYSVGRVLVRGNMEVYKILTEAKDYKTKVMPMVKNDPEILAELLSLGYPQENILGTDRVYQSDFMLALFKELDITHFIMLGSEKRGLTERIESINRSMVKATVFGAVPKEDGLNADQMWNAFCDRFNIEDY